MANFLAHFSINANDIDRARRFYQNVFGWKFQAYGPPGFFMIETGATAKELAMLPVRGSLQQRREIVSGVPIRGFECTISVKDVEATVKAAESNGAKIAMPVCTLAGIGRLCFLEDPEGNIVGAMQYDASAE